MYKNNCENKNFHTNTNTHNIKDISDFVATHMLPRQAHWPISGENAARHSSGGHTNAILKNPQAYQPFDPKDVGKEITFIFGPLSGSNHAQSIIKNQGYICNNDEKIAVTEFIKDYFKASIVLELNGNIESKILGLTMEAKEYFFN